MSGIADEWRYAALREAPLWLVVRHPSRSITDVRAFCSTASVILAAGSLSERAEEADALAKEDASHILSGASSRTQVERPLSWESGRGSSQPTRERLASHHRKRSRSASPLPPADPSSAAPPEARGPSPPLPTSAPLKALAATWLARQPQTGERERVVPQRLALVAMDVFLKTPVYYTALFRTRSEADTPSDERPVALVLAHEHWLSPTHSRGGMRGAAADLAGVVAQLRAAQSKAALSSPSDAGVTSDDCLRLPPSRLGCIVFGPTGRGGGNASEVSPARSSTTDSATAATAATVTPLKGTKTAHSVHSGPALTPPPLHASPLPVASQPSFKPLLPSHEVSHGGHSAPTGRTDPTLLAEAFPPLTLDLFDDIIIVVLHSCRVAVVMPPKAKAGTSDVKLMQRNLEVFFQVLRYVSGHPTSASPRVPDATATSMVVGTEPPMSPMSPYGEHGRHCELGSMPAGNCSFGLPGSASGALLPKPPSPRTGDTAATTSYTTLPKLQESGTDMQISCSVASHLTVSAAPAAMTLPLTTATAGAVANHATTGAVSSPTIKSGNAQTSSASYVSNVSFSNRTGASSSSINRVLIPSAFERELEAFRMVATNLPLDRDAVRASRMALRRGMLSYYGAKAERKEIRDIFRRLSRKRMPPHDPTLAEATQAAPDPQENTRGTGARAGGAAAPKKRPMLSGVKKPAAVRGEAQSTPVPAAFKDTGTKVASDRQRGPTLPSLLPHSPKKATGKRPSSLSATSKQPVKEARRVRPSLPQRQSPTATAARSPESGVFAPSSVDTSTAGPGSQCNSINNQRPVSHSGNNSASNRINTRPGNRSGSDVNSNSDSTVNNSSRRASHQWSLRADNTMTTSTEGSPNNASVATLRYASNSFSTTQRALAASGGVAQSCFSPDSSVTGMAGSETADQSPKQSTSEISRSASVLLPAHATSSPSTNNIDSGNTTSGEHAGQHRLEPNTGSALPLSEESGTTNRLPYTASHTEGSSPALTSPLKSGADKASSDFQAHIDHCDKQHRAELESSQQGSTAAVAAPTRDAANVRLPAEDASESSSTASDGSSNYTSDSSDDASVGDDPAMGRGRDSGAGTQRRGRGGGAGPPRRGGASVAEDTLTSVDSLKSMQEIIPGLWCGSYVPATKKEVLKAHHITHICCCVDVGRFPFPEDFMYMKVPVMDTNETDIASFFPRTFEFIENALIKQRGAVLVHCGAGISRAPTITAAYLIRKLRLSAAAAIALVQQRRPFASPNNGFRRQLRAYAEKMKVAPLDTVKEAQILEQVERSAMQAINEAKDDSSSEDDTVKDAAEMETRKQLEVAQGVETRPAGATATPALKQPAKP